MSMITVGLNDQVRKEFLSWCQIIACGHWAQPTAALSRSSLSAVRTGPCVFDRA